MKQRELKRLEHELGEFFDSMLEGIGRRERRASMEAYVAGLLLDGDRKSIEPMAARLVDDAAEIQGMRQRLQECVSVSTWCDTEMQRRIAGKLERELPGVEALVIDDTGFPKKGVHSVGVARQYSGTLGRIENCQVGVSLHLAGDQTSGCIGLRLYLPEPWAEDVVRRRKVGIPDEVRFREKWRIALDLVDNALQAGVRRHVVLADAGYGDTGEFRDGLTERQLRYVVGVKGDTVVWPPGSKPKLRSKRPGTRGRPPTICRDEKHPPIAITKLASRLTYRRVTWREGSRGRQSSRFAAVRIRTAHRHLNGHPPGAEQWLLCQWLDGESAPTKFWLSTLPSTTSIRTLVRFAKLRWRVERDYQEMKQELGLDHFEGRSWRGFHHHATLCAVAHAFLALRRALFPPEAEVDPPDGPPRPSARAVKKDRVLPALSPAARSHGPTARTVENLIE